MAKRVNITDDFIRDIKEYIKLVVDLKLEERTTTLISHLATYMAGVATAALIGVIYHATP